jgi:hypothetical protein
MGRSGRALVLREDIGITFNVRVILRRKGDGRPLAVRDGHNVLINQGRTWATSLLGAAHYPVEEPPEGTFPGDPAEGRTWTVEDANGETMENYRMRYVAFGDGGMYNGGSFQESNALAYMESPLPLDSGESQRYLKQILTQDDPEDLVTFPDDYTVAFRCILEVDDISFAETKNISEVAAFTSLANPMAKPDYDTFEEGVPGMVAWHCFDPIPKPNAQDLVLETIWYWRH